MADTALSEQTDSDKPERACAWCRADISHRALVAKFCGSTCREREKSFRKAIASGHWPREKQGPRPPATCPECGVVFEQVDPRQVFCERNGSCHQKAWRRTDRAKHYFSQEEVRRRMREAARRHAETEHGKAAQRERDARPHNVKRRREYSMSDHGKAIKREWQRRRAAQQALSLLILPIEDHQMTEREWPEQKQPPLEWPEKHQ